MEAPIAEGDMEDWENLVFASWRSQSVEAVFLNLFASGICPDVVGSFGRVIISDLQTWGISFHHSMLLVFLGKSLEAGEPGNRFLNNICGDWARDEAELVVWPIQWKAVSRGPGAYTLQSTPACIAGTVKLKKYQYLIAVPSLSHDVWGAERRRGQPQG